MTRRSLFASLLSAGFARGQGVASRGVRATPRGKASGIPFPSKLTDIAAEAGLKHPAICGAVDKKDYLVEVMGCGVAFIYYDNDGWLDIFVPSASRLERTEPPSTNRLYRNNRDGTF